MKENALAQIYINIFGWNFNGNSHEIKQKTYKLSLTETV